MDSAQWLSITEEALFLHDGLVRVSDLIELPHDITSTLNINPNDVENDITAYDSKTPSELSDKLLAVCATQNYSYTRLLEYRLNALSGLWNAQRNLAPPLQYMFGKDGQIPDEVVAVLKKQGLWKEPEQAAFTQRIGFLLLLPLLQSQSKLDNSVCSTTTQLLFSSLRQCLPSSLAKEPPECLDGLESLLCSWIQTSHDQTFALSSEQLHTAASSVVAFACARLVNYIVF